jgi:two-component system nitrate/nitrite sensor histidine kinase NarX
MLSLREKVDPNQGIIPILEGMLLRFEQNWGIKTELVKECCLGATAKTMLSSKTEIQLIRIIQEALNNIRRHANAHTATIKVSEQANGLVFSIIDDGIGFRLEDIPQESLGLRILHERAASVGAIVKIESVQGSGTTLSIYLPVSAGVHL